MTRKSPKLKLVSSAAGWVVEIVSPSVGKFTPKPRYYVAMPSAAAAVAAVRRLRVVALGDSIEAVRSLTEHSIEMLKLKPGEIRLYEVT